MARGGEGGGRERLGELRSGQGAERGGEEWGWMGSICLSHCHGIMGVGRQIRKHLLKHLACKGSKAQDLVGSNFNSLHYSTTSGRPSHSPSHH